MLGILACLSAIVHLATAVAAIFPILRPGQVQLLFRDTVSDAYWIMSATLSTFLFFAYIWPRGSSPASTTDGQW